MNNGFIIIKHIQNQIILKLFEIFVLIVIKNNTLNKY